MSLFSLLSLSVNGYLRFMVIAPRVFSLLSSIIVHCSSSFLELPFFLLSSRTAHHYMASANSVHQGAVLRPRPIISSTMSNRWRDQPTKGCKSRRPTNGTSMAVRPVHSDTNSTSLGNTHPRSSTLHPARRLFIRFEIGQNGNRAQALD